MATSLSAIFFGCFLPRRVVNQAPRKSLDKIVEGKVHCFEQRVHDCGDTIKAVESPTWHELGNHVELLKDLGHGVIRVL